MRGKWSAPILSNDGFQLGGGVSCGISAGVFWGLLLCWTTGLGVWRVALVIAGLFGVMRACVWVSLSLSRRFSLSLALFLLVEKLVGCLAVWWACCCEVCVRVCLLVGWLRCVFAWLDRVASFGYHYSTNGARGAEVWSSHTRQISVASFTS